MSNGELDTSDGSDPSDEFDDSDDASLYGNSSSVGHEGTALHPCEPSYSQDSDVLLHPCEPLCPQRSEVTVVLLHSCEPSCSQPSLTQTTCGLRPSTKRHKPACATSALTSLALARQHQRKPAQEKRSCAQTSFTQLFISGATTATTASTSFQRPRWLQCASE